MRGAGDRLSGDGSDYSDGLLVDCNLEIESNVCYQATCLDAQSDWPHPNGESYVPVYGRRYSAPATFAELA